MLATIVLWWVPAIAIFVFLYCIIEDEWHDRKPDFGDAASCGFFTLIVGWICGLLLLGVILLFATSTTGVEQKTVNEQTFQVSDKSKLEYKEHYYVKFISEDENGNLTPQQIDFEDIYFENLGGKTIEVKTVDHFHPWLVSWPINTTTTVVLK